MNRAGRQRRVNLITALILSAGLAAAVAIYLTAEEPAQNPLIDQLENSKIYQRSLEIYGGKANLLAEQFTRWFTGLWQGRKLAFTVALGSAAAAGLFHFFASPLPPERK